MNNHLIEQIKIKLDLHSIRSITIKDELLFEKVMKTYKIIADAFQTKFVLLSGEFVSFLEGLLTDFKHVDIFVLINERNEFKSCDLILLIVNIFWNKLTDGEEISRPCYWYERGFNTRLGNYILKRFYVKYPFLKTEIAYNLFLVENLKPCSCWSEAFEKICNNFPIPLLRCVSDCHLIFRKSEASILPDPVNNTSELCKDFVKRVIHFGIPNSLLKTSWDVIKSNYKQNK